MPTKFPVAVRGGFTLIELMVASILLGMVVMVLTMLFDSAAIAWRTGTAGVVLLEDARKDLGTIHSDRDSVLPGLGEEDVRGENRSLNYRTVSLWKDGSLRTDRAFDTTMPAFDLPSAHKGASIGINGGSTVGGSLFTVGVRSAGPDGEYGTEDDITTWPDEVF